MAFFGGVQVKVEGFSCYFGGSCGYCSKVEGFSCYFASDGAQMEEFHKK
jgi:hypothetical protein